MENNFEFGSAHEESEEKMTSRVIKFLEAWRSNDIIYPQISHEPTAGSPGLMGEQVVTLPDVLDQIDNAITSLKGGDIKPAIAYIESEIRKFEELGKISPEYADRLNRYSEGQISGGGGDGKYEIRDLTANLNLLKKLEESK